MTQYAKDARIRAQNAMQGNESILKIRLHIGPMEKGLNGLAARRNKRIKTITRLYCIICQCNDSRYIEGKQRLSNNSCPQFSDEELITVYHWGKAQ